jgi:hypothetical protein
MKAWLFRPKFFTIHLRLRAVAALIGILLLLGAAIAPVTAQDPEQFNWSPIDQVYSSGRTLFPRLIPDSTGVLHLMWAGLVFGQERTEPHALMYARWDGMRWTEPVDVIVTDDFSDLREPDGVIDAEGTLHVIFGGPRLYYTSVLADEADNASNWSEPRLIGDGEFVISRSDITIDQDGVIHVVVADGQKNEVYYLASADSGVNWTLPVELSSSPDKVATTNARIDVDSNGVLHAVWMRNPLPEAYPPQGIFYAHSEDGGQTWSREQQLAGTDFGDPDIIVDTEDRLHLVYNGAATISGGKYHRWSADGGLTWSEPFEVAPKGGGLNGVPAVSVDSEGVLHFFGGDGNHLWYSVWQDNVWSPPVDIHILDPNEINYTETAGMTILLGNQLHLAFDDEQTQLWHTWRTLDIPSSAPQPFVEITVARPDASDQNESEAEAAETPTPSGPILSESDKSRDTAATVSSIDTMFFGIGLASVFLIVILVFSILRRGRRVFRR